MARNSFPSSPNHPDSSLAGAQVNDIVEDAFGNLWIATDNGLSRYDVHQRLFTNFRRDKETDSVLPTNSLTCLLVDSQYVWIGSNFGLGRINIEDYSTEIWRNDSTHQDDILKGSINSMLVVDQTLFLSTSQGISMLDLAEDTFTNLDVSTTPDDYAAKDIKSILLDSSGTFWITSVEAGYARLVGDWDDPVFETFPVGSPAGPAHRLVNDIEQGPFGQLYLATYDGLTVVHTGDSMFSTHYQSDGTDRSLSHNQCFEVYFDNADRIWVGTGSGLDISDPYFIQFTTLSHVPNNDATIIDDMVYALEEDSQGNLWVGTFNRGITVIDTRGQYHHIGMTEGLSTNQVIALEEFQPGIMWVGTFDGINEVHWDGEEGLTSIRRLPNGPAENCETPSPYIYDLQWDGKLMWVVSYYAGLFYLDPPTQKWWSGSRSGTCKIAEQGHWILPAPGTRSTMGWLRERRFWIYQYRLRLSRVS